MTFEYRCVAGPTIVAVRSSKARDQAVKAFEEIMNAQAVQGWEYVGIDEFHVSEPQGLLSRKRVFVPSKILVFRRTVAQAAAPEPPRLHARDEPHVPAPQVSGPPVLAAQAPEPQDTPEFKTALQSMSEKLRAARG